jgi:hypothetical protein
MASRFFMVRTPFFDKILNSNRENKSRFHLETVRLTQIFLKIFLS